VCLRALLRQVIVALGVLGSPGVSPVSARDGVGPAPARVFAPSARLVFVTSDRYSGDLGGMGGADGLCQAHADEAGLPGTYKAWLSDSQGGSPSTRFTPSPGPYRLVDGTLIARNWQDLTDGFIEAQIGLDENGKPAPRAFNGLDAWFVWTGTKVDGTPDTTMSDFGGFCHEPGKGDWENDLVRGFKIQCGYNGVGTVRGAYLDSVWTENGFQPCDFEAHLYCFQQ